jgi:phosphoribosylformylglycinamidine synthase
MGQTSQSLLPREICVPRVVVEVMPKQEILDPQGAAVRDALGRLGFEVSAVRQGKRFVLEVESLDENTLSRVTDMASTLLANPVIEDFAVRLEEPA